MTKRDDYVRRFTKTTLSCGKNLIELSTYNDVTLWWFVRLRFYDFINRMLGEEGRLTRNRLVRTAYKTFEPCLDFSMTIGVRLVLKLLGRDRIDGNEENDGASRIAFTSQDVEWKSVRDYETGAMKKSDAFFDSTIARLGNKYQFLGIYPLGASVGSLRVFIDKLRNWSIPHRPFNLYWSLATRKSEKEASNHFKELWKNLTKDENFGKLCVCDGRNLQTQIRTELEFYFSVLFPRAIKNIEIAKRMIYKKKTNLILLQNEYSEFERALVIAAKFEGIPTLAIQHGVITPTHYGYIFDKEDEDKVILPDVTCVNGQYHYELLTEQSVYQAGKVVVTGQPRYDILYFADKIFSREEFLKNYKINPHHRILLWTTQCHGLSNEENARNFGTVFETMQNLENVTLLIKQHPGEEERYTKIIEDYLAKYKIDVVLAPKTSDTYEQLFFCDLLMTKSSTTAMEAVALSKPVIILNLSGEPDAVDYVEQGVASGVYKEDDLKSSVEKLLKDDSELAKNRQRYIRKYLYRIDGKATERVVNLIEGMILEAGKKDERTPRL